MKYNEEHIYILLEKYWEGQTSLEEEASIRSYFLQEEIAEDLAVYKAFFTEIEAQKTPTLSADFDTQLMQQIADLEAQKTPIRKLKPQQWFLKIAATMVLVMGTALFVFSESNENNSFSQAEKIEAERAFQDIKIVMNVLSKKLNKGRKPLKQLGKMNQVMTGNLK